MKIQVRLMLVILPVLVIVHLFTSIITTIFSTAALENQARDNAQLLSQSYSVQLNSTIDHYLSASQDLGSAVITAVHIETTLKAFRGRYPQFTKIFYTPPDGKVLEMAPYEKDLVSFDLEQTAGWQRAFHEKSPVMSAPTHFLGEESVIFFAPSTLSYVVHQEHAVAGVVALVLPLKELFKDISDVKIGDSGSVFIVDGRGLFLHSKDADADAVLSKSLDSLPSVQPLGEVSKSMTEQQAGFATYSDGDGKKYISFSPIHTVGWSLGVHGTYAEITSEITKITLVNVCVIIVGVLIGMVILYYVVYSVVRPIEKLTTLARKIAKGDRTITSDITSSSEIGQLSSSINSMVSELRDSQRKLEMTVEERTAELKKANDALGETNEELNRANMSLEKSRDGLELVVAERTLQLQKALNYIDNIIDSMPSLLVGIDPEGIVTHWNTEAQNITGLSSGEAIGHPLAEVMPRLADEMGNVRQALETREEYIDPKRTRLEKNQTYYENITVYPLVANGVEGAVIRVDDITEQVAVEESLHQSQKLDAIGQLAGGVAHDFNNMLSGILGAAQLLKTPMMNLDEKGLEYIEMIIKSVARASDLTAKLLAFGRKGKIMSTPIDVHHVIDDVLAIFKRTLDKKISLIVEKEAENHTVIGDDSAIQNALMNLGINSSHAMADGGELKIVTKNIRLTISFCDANPFEIEPGDYLEIQIRDTGCGIPRPYLSKIFEPFFTTKKPDSGTGLGLAAVYGIVKDHHGAIAVLSEEGTGTVFHIYLPCSEELVSAVTQVETVVATGEGKILLVDDEEIIRIASKYLLQDMGYDVLVAENGEEGLELFQKYHHEIDLVIMDMIMPVMNGREAFFKMKEIDRDCKVVIASGFLNDKKLTELKSAGLAGFMLKPFRDFELSVLLKELLAK